MKIFVAGASGAVGKRLVPMLVATGYDVVAMTHSPGRWIRCKPPARTRWSPTASTVSRS